MKGSTQGLLDFEHSDVIHPANNAKLTQSGWHQSGSQKMPTSIPTGGTFFTKIILLFPM